MWTHWHLFFHIKIGRSSNHPLQDLHAACLNSITFREITEIHGVIPLFLLLNSFPQFDLPWPSCGHSIQCFFSVANRWNHVWQKEEKTHWKNHTAETWLLEKSKSLNGKILIYWGSCGSWICTQKTKTNNRTKITDENHICNNDI